MSVIDASLHLLVAQDLITETSNLASEILNTDASISQRSKRKLAYVTKLATNAVEIVKIGSLKHCKSSSYVKCGAYLLITI